MANDPRLTITADEFADMARDAKRYRWLRDKSNYARKSDPMVCQYPLWDQKLIDGEELDAAIDAAMQANK